MAVAHQRISLDTFLSLPEQKPALEYMDGVVTQKMSPKLLHSVVQAEFTLLFGEFLRHRGLGHVLPELRTTYLRDNASLVPDVAVYLAGRLPTKPNGDLAEDMFDPPDIAVEILSPGQTMSQMLRRARWFADRGVCATVIANPRTRAIRVVRPGDETPLLRGAAIVDLGDILPGFSFVVQDLFAALDVR